MTHSIRTAFWFSLLPSGVVAVAGMAPLAVAALFGFSFVVVGAITYWTEM